jgi:predicted DCC family thiol-disulfide oxidoreductase YuxK
MTSMIQHDARWPLQVFFDGACPICSREMAHYRRKDRLGRLECIDVSDPRFVASDHGLDARAVDEVMHVRTADGRLHQGADAFLVIWEALGQRRLLALSHLPGVLPLMRRAYRLFARNRKRLTGRCREHACHPA